LPRFSKHGFKGVESCFLIFATGPVLAALTQGNGTEKVRIIPVLSLCDMLIG